MSATYSIQNEEEVAAEFDAMTKMQKLAVFLMIVSPENAAQIMKSLPEQELEEVAAEMIKLETVNQHLQRKVLDEFSIVAVEAATAIGGGLDRAKGLLEKSVGLNRASDMIGRLSPHREPVEAMQQILNMEVRHIFSLLRHEQLQTVVLIVSYLGQEKAAQLLGLFRLDLRDQIIERLATMAPISVQVVEQVAEGLQSRMGNNRSRTFNQTGGVRAAAEVLNRLPQNVSKAILSSLTDRSAELGEAIFKKMFTFEELDRLDTKTLQVLMQHVDMHQMAVALKTASEKLKKALLASITKRAGEAMLEEIFSMGPLKLSEIEAARTQILATVRTLEEDGEINLEELRQQSRRN